MLSMVLQRQCSIRLQWQFAWRSFSVSSRAGHLRTCAKFAELLTQRSSCYEHFALRREKKVNIFSSSSFFCSFTYQRALDFSFPLRKAHRDRGSELPRGSQTEYPEKDKNSENFHETRNKNIESFFFFLFLFFSLCYYGSEEEEGHVGRADHGGVEVSVRIANHNGLNRRAGVECTKAERYQRIS